MTSLHDLSHLWTQYPYEPHVPEKMYMRYYQILIFLKLLMRGFIRVAV